MENMRNCNKSPYLQIAVFAVCSFWFLFSCKTAKSANCTNCKSILYHMTEYRFTLQKYKRGSKHTCPKCGKKQCFVRYIDLKNEINFPDYVGRCDHEVSCQYHYKPSDYFKDNPNTFEEKDYPIKKNTFTKAREPRSISYIDRSIMELTLSNYDKNPIYHYMTGLFGKDETLRLFQLYHVGTAKKWGGSTVYWQIDKEGKVRTGKIMLYDPTSGHRIKEPRSYVSWVHTELALDEFNLKQCFFGEHLLTDHPYKSVAIVESEKSALIATHYMPDFIWLATGGMHGCFKEDSINVLKNRTVILCPDLGASETWKSKMNMLSSVCSKVVLSEKIEQCATEEQRAKGLDIADFLLMDNTPMMILQKMIKSNPNLQKLIDCLQLELVDST